MTYPGPVGTGTARMSKLGATSLDELRRNLFCVTYLNGLKPTPASSGIRTVFAKSGYP